MIIYTTKVIFLKCQILTFFLLWNVKNVKLDLMISVKMATLSAQFVLKNALSNIDFPKCRKEIAASLNEFSNRWCKLEMLNLMP